MTEDMLLLNVTSWCHAVKWSQISPTQERRVKMMVIGHLQFDQRNRIFQLAKTEDEAMARFRNMSFSTLRLEDRHTADFKHWVEQQKIDPLSVITELTGQGYKVSCSWVDESNAFCLSIIGTENTKVNRDVVMTTWSDDLEEVICLAGFKHMVVCDSGEWPITNNDTRWG